MFLRPIKTQLRFYLGGKYELSARIIEILALGHSAHCRIPRICSIVTKSSKKSSALSSSLGKRPLPVLEYITSASNCKHLRVFHNQSGRHLQQLPIDWREHCEPIFNLRYNGTYLLVMAASGDHAESFTSEESLRRQFTGSDLRDEIEALSAIFPEEIKVNYE